jgi:hypothetical protein
MWHTDPRQPGQALAGPWVTPGGSAADLGHAHAEPQFKFMILLAPPAPGRSSAAHTTVTVLVAIRVLLPLLPLAMMMTVAHICSR